MRVCLVLLDPPAGAVPFAPATPSRRAVTASRRLTRPAKSPAILERERGKREGEREGKKIEAAKERERERGVGKKRDGGESAQLRMWLRKYKRSC